MILIGNSIEYIRSGKKYRKFLKWHKKWMRTSLRWISFVISGTPVLTISTVWFSLDRSSQPGIHWPYLLSWVDIVVYVSPDHGQINLPLGCLTDVEISSLDASFPYTVNIGQFWIIILYFQVYDAHFMVHDISNKSTNNITWHRYTTKHKRRPDIDLHDYFLSFKFSVFNLFLV